jgi:rhodanese-related sulfurtransferase
VVAAALAVGLVPLAGCAGGGSGPGTPAAQAATAAPAGSFTDVARQARAEGRVVIDVRTPEEVAAGAIAGATVIDFRDPGFAGAIAALDRSVAYVVYCRSGNRAGQAIAQMAALGLDAVNGGGLEDMLAAGWPAA